MPVRLVGPLSAPQYKIDFGSIAANYAQAALQGKTEEIKVKVEDKVKGKLQDKLKGLFGH